MSLKLKSTDINKLYLGDASINRAYLGTNLAFGEENLFSFEAVTTEATQSFHMPLLSTSTVNATVDWGDGTINTITSYDDPNAIHEYAVADTYNVVVTGELNGWSFGEYKAAGDNDPAPVSFEDVQIGSGLTLTLDDGTSTDFEVDITAANGGTPITLPAGNYWISFAPRVTGASAGSGRWNWNGSDYVAPYEGVLIDPGNLFGGGFTSWTGLESTIGTGYNSLNGVLTDSLGNDLYNVTPNTAGIISTNGSTDDGVLCSTYITLTQEATLGTFSVQGMMSGVDNTIAALLTGADFFIYEDANLGVPVTPGTSLYSTLIGDVSNWGQFDITEPGAFSQCVNMTITATDTPSISGDSLADTFSNCASLTTIPSIGYWNVSNVLYMNSCFNDCSITNINDINNWGSTTSNVVDATSMFSVLNATSLNLSSWDVSSLTNISDMFFNSSLVSIDLTNWSSNVITNFISAFQGCNSLTTVTGIETLINSNATDISTLFDDCSSLAAINASAWDTSSVVTATQVFNRCTSLTSINMSNLDLSSMTNMSQMFRNCSSLTTLDVSGWKNGGSIIMAFLFSNASQLVSIDLSASVCTPSNTSGMYSGCTNLVSTDMTGWDFTNTVAVSSMFSNASNLETITGHEDFRFTGLTTSMNYMFTNCSSLTTLDTSLWAVTGVTSFQYTFSGCTVLTALDLSGWNTTNATDMTWTFAQMQSLVSLDLTGWDTSNVTTTLAAFYDLRSVTSTSLIGFEDLDVSSVVNAEFMFGGTTQNDGFPSGGGNNFDLSNWRFTSLVNGNQMFKNNRLISTLDVSNWDMSLVTNIDSIFETLDFCTSMIGLNTWNTGLVQNFEAAFQNNKINPNIDIAGWDVSSATNMKDMVYDCDLFDQDLSGWDINQVSNFTSFMTNSSGMSTANYDATLIGWAAQIPLAYNGTLDFGGSQYTLGGAAATAHANLITDVGAISDGGGI